MITSRLTRRDFCHAAILAVIPASRKNSVTCRLPLPEMKLGTRVRTERVCNDRTSKNYGNIDWECGFIVGYVWQYDAWKRDDYRYGWTYWVRFDQTSYEIFDDCPWIDFVHHSEVVKV